MWRVVALLVIVCAGCASQRPSWLPDAGLMLDDRKTFFARTDRDDLLPPNPGSIPPPSKGP